MIHEQGFANNLYTGSANNLYTSSTTYTHRVDAAEHTHLRSAPTTQRPNDLSRLVHDSSGSSSARLVPKRRSYEVNMAPV